MSQTIQPAAIRKSLTVAASPETAFKVFTEGFDRWWPKTHTIGKAALAKAVIEPREGGRWYGLDGNGHEDEWGDVLAWEPPERLLLAWRINGLWTYDPTLLTEIEVRGSPQRRTAGHRSSSSIAIWNAWATPQSRRGP